MATMVSADRFASLRAERDRLDLAHMSLFVEAPEEKVAPEVVEEARSAIQEALHRRYNSVAGAAELLEELLLDPDNNQLTADDAGALKRLAGLLMTADEGPQFLLVPGRPQS